MKVYKKGISQEVSMESTESTGHPKVTRIKKETRIYGSVLEQREFGLGKFLKKSFWQTFRPRHVLRRLGYGAAGLIMGGPLGYYAGRFLANRKAWDQETERYGHSFDDDDQQEFSDTRENASEDLIKRAKTSGVVQKVGDSWRIVSVKKGKLWDAHYGSREKAEAALRAYQANR